MKNEHNLILRLKKQPVLTVIEDKDLKLAICFKTHEVWFVTILSIYFFIKPSLSLSLKEFYFILFQYLYQAFFSFPYKELVK